MKSNIKRRVCIYGVAFLLVAYIFTLQKGAPHEITETYLDMFDTVSEITVYAKNDKALSKCEKYMQTSDSELSAENGTLYRYNSGEDAEFSQDAENLISFAKDFTAENSDYFSVYLNPVIKAWDIKNNSGTIPDVSLALSKAAEQKELNLGACAKGFVSMRLADILTENGVSSALINLGGNTYALGTKPDGSKWKIGIQNPKDENGIVAVISAENLAVVTSGDYQRYFDLNGKRYHHILDPKTGYPTDNGLHSVTVVCSDALLADALSTAAFVAGVDEGQKLLEKYNAYGIFITDNTVYFSKDLENILKQKDFSYKYEFLN